MSSVIYKYPLKPGQATVRLPEHADILRIATQGDREEHVLWALVDTEDKVVSFPVLCVGTGHTLSSDDEELIRGAIHYETTLTMQGRLVLHWFIGSESR